jgi:hypothetical protein
MGPADDQPKNIPVSDGDDTTLPQGDTPGVNKEAEKPAQPQQPLPPSADQLKVTDTKKFAINGFQKEVLQNYLNIQQLNQFQLRAHLQILGEKEWGIKADQFTRFGLNLEQNEVTVEFLEPIAQSNGGLETAPPVPAQ